MKTVSFRDLLLAPALSHAPNEFHLLRKEMDISVKEVLAILGIDVEKGVEYFVANHRDWQNNTGVGFVARGEVKYSRTNSFLSVDERISAHAFRDEELCLELFRIAGRVDVNRTDESPGGGMADTWGEDPSCAEISQRILEFRKIMAHIRGEKFVEEVVGSKEKRGCYMQGRKTKRPRKGKKTNV